MSNDPRENLHGSDSQELADVTADAARTSDEAPAPRSALSSFEEILSGTTHEADAPTADEATETLADDGAQDLQETLVSSTPLVTDTAEASPAALVTDAAAAAQTTAQTSSDVAPETATPQAAPEQPSQELTPANSANTTGNSAATNANNAVAAPTCRPPSLAPGTARAVPSPRRAAAAASRLPAWASPTRTT